MIGCGAILVVLYVVLACAPAALAAWLGPRGHSFLYQAGRTAALTGLTMLVLQGVMVARWKWATRHFGLDVVTRFHRRTAMLAGLLLLAHPILLFAGGSALDGDGLPWYVWAGAGVLVLLLANLFVSTFSEEIGLTFERWRLAHGVLGVALLGGAFVHAWLAGGDFRHPFMQGVLIVLVGGGLVVFVHHRLIRPALLRRKAWRVTDVIEEAERVWTVELEPPQGRDVYDYLPGQFHFITLHRGRDLPEEEHHFTISSSPSRRGRVASTIKAVGDFTATTGDTRPGDAASVQGAFGRFSYALHPDERDLVFIAGGIGITPLMSMLRCMRDREEDLRVLLLYGNRNEASVVFRDELAAIEAGERPDLKVVHVLDDPGEQWTGETGRVDRDVLRRCVGEDVAGRTFYLCGPPGMLKSVLADLREMGVKDARIRTEIFSLIG